MANSLNENLEVGTMVYPAEQAVELERVTR